MSLKRWIFLTDVHGDMQDPEAVAIASKFLDIWKPTIRICGGDLWDFRPLRRGACDDEKRESLKADFDAGKKWFNRFKPTVFLRGNHDERLWELAAKDNGVASDFAQEGIGRVEAMVSHHRCKMLPYHKREGIYRLGDTLVFHGMAGGISAARVHAMTYGESCMFGHVHSFATAPVPGLEAARVGRSIGCLCKTDQDYNSRQLETLKQENGFAYGVLNDKTGAVHTWEARKIGGKWILPNGYVEL